MESLLTTTISANASKVYQVYDCLTFAIFFDFDGKES